MQNPEHVQPVAPGAHPGSDNPEGCGPPPSAAIVPITVVVPVRNEADSMAGLLDALATQTARPAAVIVVDAGSTDGTRAILRDYQRRDPSLTVIEVDQAYPGVGRNLGTEAAQTEWVAYVDAGALPDRGMIEAFGAAVAAHPHVDAVYGFYRPLLTSRLARWFALVALPGARRQGQGLMRNHVTPCSVVRRSAWQRVGGFPPFRAAEDRIFMAAIDQGSVVETPDAVLTWFGPQTWRQLWRRTHTLGEHSARAGRARDWHWPTLRIWMTGALVLGLLPSPSGLGLVGIATVARAVRRLQRHQVEAPLCQRRWDDVPGVMLTLLVMDVAVFWGWLKALARPDRR